MSLVSMYDKTHRFPWLAPSNFFDLLKLILGFIDATRATQFSSELVSKHATMDNLPQDLVNEILKRIADVNDIANFSETSRAFREASYFALSIRIQVRNSDHKRTRNLLDSFSPNSGLNRQDLKDNMGKFLLRRRCIEQLHIEVDPMLQSKEVPDNKRSRTDFWMSDPCFVSGWSRHLGATLQHLCMVDYGKQAVLRKSSILQILSQNCKSLKTVDLRNMYIDTSGCETMSSLVSMTLHCVAVPGGALDDMNTYMPKLQTMVLYGVVGVERGHLTFSEMKFLSLGLSNPAEAVFINLPKLEKLQLKMKCPRELEIVAPRLKPYSFNLEVPEQSKVHIRY
ncbi:F-box/LRR-repeat protein At4g29420 isoform X1 [Physcomitrium patens]|uniref:F-box domain-containing protein n=1 Tax=Physcomitrium patens TaxID=3218 RepID=A0A2K1I9U0_PHYPA|nr:uncharacterized protein LOC112278612 isoform X1 [Physcomitrium patens]PNR26046.1 hypothetical protein PHYPA_031187 [Physcomitrium patens]|eukprot:XP_024367979.1 uncharacterized protein LOC112278612 isoform X1 [Physcomitrella patens]